MNTKVATINNIEHRLVVILGALLLVEAFMYVYFVNSSIFNVVARKETEEMVSVTETEITGLVARYMSLSDQVNLALAYEKGFVDAPADGRFAVVKPEAVALSFND